MKYTSLWLQRSFGESKTDEQIPNQIPDPPVEVFTTTASNALEWSVTEKLIKAGTISSVGVEKRSSKGSGRVGHHRQ